MIVAPSLFVGLLVAEVWSWVLVPVVPLAVMLVKVAAGGGCA